MRNDETFNLIYDFAHDCCALNQNKKNAFNLIIQKKHQI